MRRRTPVSACKFVIENVLKEISQDVLTVHSDSRLRDDEVASGDQS